MKKILLLLPLVILAFTGGSYKIPDGKNYSCFVMPSGVKYASNTVLFKLKNSDGHSAELTRALSLLGAAVSEQVFKNTSKPTQDFTFTGERLADLSSIYRIRYNSPVSVEDAVNTLLQTGEVEYAEPDYYREVAFTPNDTGFASQYHLTKIQAAQGWDIQKGDTNVIIAIIDSGTDIDHPDLNANFKRNYADTLDGEDNDGNGFVDDFMGWDFGGADYNRIVGDNDPDIKGFNNAHGSHVSGDASAVTDNLTGVSGAGFRCKLLPLKAAADNDTRGADGTGLIIAGYESIKYAADMGAQIINCSWGGGGRSQTEQEVIRYAAINKGALVVCAAGNNNSDDPFYPASYKFVLSVAAADINDSKAPYSNYGNTVDVSAPGSNIFSTVYNNTYNQSSGTSMASPITAGVCAIVKSQFPGLTGLQIGEKVRVTSDNINSTIPVQYQDRMGKGRVNMFRALTVSSPSVRIDTFTVTDNNDNIFESGDTLSINCTLKNWLDPVTGLNLSLSSYNSPFSVLEGNAGISSLKTFGIASVNFKVRVETAPLNAELILKLNYSSGQYQDFEYFTVDVNPSYADLTAADVKTTLNSVGNFAFNNFPENTQGIGFSYRNSGNLTFEGGLICAVSSGKVSDVIRGNNNIQNKDFAAIQPLIITEPGSVSAQDGTAKFSDAASNANTKIGVEVTMNSYAFTGAGYIILKYRIKNISGANITNFYTGLFSDWDIGSNGARNKASYIDSLQLGYAWRTDNNPSYHTGIALLSANNPAYWAIDNETGIQGNPFSIYDNFTKSEKYTSLSKGIGRREAGGTNGRDISMVMGTGPYTIERDSTIEVGFALVAGDNLLQINTNTSEARVKYREFFPVYNFESGKVSYSLIQNAPNPFGAVQRDFTEIKYTLEKDGLTKLEIFDILGRKVATLVNEFQTTSGQGSQYIVTWNGSNLPSGVYFYRLTSGDFEETKKLVLLR